MQGQEFLTAPDEFAQEAGGVLRLGALRLGQLVGPGLQGHVVRRRAVDALVAALNHQQMAVLHAGTEMHAVVAEHLLQIADERVALLRLQTAAGMILQDVALHADEVAAQGQVALLQLHADGGGLQGAAPLIHLMLVVAQDAAVGHLAAGMEAIGHRLQQAVAPVAGQPVHVGHVGMLQQGFPSEVIAVPVGHAVAENDDMFHTLKPDS